MSATTSSTVAAESGARRKSAVVAADGVAEKIGRRFPLFFYLCGVLLATAGATAAFVGAAGLPGCEGVVARLVLILATLLQQPIWALASPTGWRPCW